MRLGIVHQRIHHASPFGDFSAPVLLSHALADDDIALEEADDGLWNIPFDNSLIGRFDQRTSLITGADFRHSKG